MVSVVLIFGCVIDITCSPFTPGTLCSSSMVMRSTVLMTSGSVKMSPFFASIVISRTFEVPNILRYFW